MAKYTDSPLKVYPNPELIPDSIQNLIRRNRIPTDDKYADFGVSHWDELNNLLMRRAINFKAAHFKLLLEELQANILKPHKKEHAWYVFLRFLDEEEAKRFIAVISGELTSALKQIEDRMNGETKVGTKPELLNFYLTWHGYDFLQIPERQRPGQEGGAFKQGFLNRTKFDREEVEKKYVDPTDVHAMIFMADDLAQVLEDKLDELEKALSDTAAIISVEKGRAIFEETGQGKVMKDWFGYREGISQPIFFPDSSRNVKKREPLRQEDIAPLGLALLHDPCGQYTSSCGSYLVWMKLQQNQDAFSEAVSKINNLLSHPDDELAAAYLMGRFKNGTPVTSADAPLHNEEQVNHFQYTDYIKNHHSFQSDEEGVRCPMHAHARKANPRVPGLEDKRIVRRGITYGNPEDEEKGLFFCSFQRSLEAQFEYIMHNWLQFHVLDGKNCGQDPLLASNSVHSCFIPKKWNGSPESKEELRLGKPLVTFKGGFYLFAPSLHFLKNILVTHPPKSRKEVVIRNPAPPALSKFRQNRGPNYPYQELEP